MIKKVFIQGFFSFKEETCVELNSGVNLLLGINGSGKTAFINALRVLSEGVVGEGLMHLIQEKWGGYDEIANANGEKPSPCACIRYVFSRDFMNSLHPSMNFPTDVSYRVMIRPSGTGYYICERMRSGKLVYLDFINGSGKISTRNSTDGKVSLQEISGDESLSGRELSVRQISDPLHYLPLFVMKKAIESFAVYSGFHVGEGSRLRVPVEYSPDTRLKKNGSNLALILNELKLRHSFAFDRIAETFRNVNHGFKSIEIDTPYGKPYLSLKEKNMRRSIGARHISDGTLRFLLMESIFYNPERGSLVGIDEPERGLHPDMIRSVAKMISHAAQTSQVIVATHSPHLLNQFSLDDILVFEKTADNVTAVRKLRSEDFPELEEEDLLPGQMWLMGHIGGKRW